MLCCSSRSLGGPVDKRNPESTVRLSDPQHLILFRKPQHALSIFPSGQGYGAAVSGGHRRLEDWACGFSGPLGLNL